MPTFASFMFEDPLSMRCPFMMQAARFRSPSEPGALEAEQAVRRSQEDLMQCHMRGSTSSEPESADMVGIF